MLMIARRIMDATLLLLQLQCDRMHVYISIVIMFDYHITQQLTLKAEVHTTTTVSYPSVPFPCTALPSPSSFPFPLSLLLLMLAIVCSLLHCLPHWLHCQQFQALHYTPENHFSADSRQCPTLQGIVSSGQGGRLRVSGKAAGLDMHHFYIQWQCV